MRINQQRNMMVFDTAYTFDVMHKLNMSLFVTVRDVEGYFDNVWTVHAVASLYCLSLIHI